MMPLANTTPFNVEMQGWSGPLGPLSGSAGLPATSSTRRKAYIYLFIYLFIEMQVLDFPQRSLAGARACAWTIVVDGLHLQLWGFTALEGEV